MLPDVTTPFALICWTRSRREGLPIQAVLIFRMLPFERLHNWSHREEVVSADVQDEFRITDVAVEVGEVVDFRDGKFKAPVKSVVVCAVLPGREHLCLVIWSLRTMLQVFLRHGRRC
jgi:hypothetical protein